MDTRYIRRAGLVIAALALIACSVPAAAQISSEVQSALRANCRGDATSKCSGLRGQEALACLQKNVNTLSPACKAILDRIGEPYMTTRQSSEEGGGLGLGLFIAKTLLERSGATTAFTNAAAPGMGATVSVVWPRNAFVAAEITGKSPY